jgi:hypothetical protein
MSNVRDLLVKALEQGSQSGCINMTVSQLARSVGVSRSTIYKYYPEVVLRVKKLSGEAVEDSLFNFHLKNKLATNKLQDNRKLISALVKICSDQLVEMEQLKSRHRDEIESRDLKITYLQGKVDKYLSVKPIK